MTIKPYNEDETKYLVSFSYSEDGMYELLVRIKTPKDNLHLLQDKIEELLALI